MVKKKKTHLVCSLRLIILEVDIKRFYFKINIKIIILNRNLVYLLTKRYIGYNRFIKKEKINY
jgi:hypothetical protein